MENKKSKQARKFKQKRHLSNQVHQCPVYAVYPHMHAIHMHITQIKMYNKKQQSPVQGNHLPAGEHELWVGDRCHPWFDQSIFCIFCFSNIPLDKLDNSKWHAFLNKQAFNGREFPSTKPHRQKRAPWATDVVWQGFRARVKQALGV